MNILFCQPTLEYTGSETCLLGVVRMLRKRGGYRLHLLAGRRGPIAGEFERHVDSLDIVNAPQLRRQLAVIPRFLWSFWTVFNEIRRLKKAHGISVVYVNTVMFPQALVGARLNGVRCVNHIHEVESTYPWMVYQFYLALATLLASRIICVCEYIQKQRRIIFKKKMRAKTHVVYNSSAFETGFIRRSCDGTIRILVVGTLSRLKGTGDVPLFARALAKKIGKDGFEIIVVGSVQDNELYNDVTETLRHMEIGDRVTFCGEQKEIERFYREAHVFLHLTHSDSFPIVLVEAASFSLPAITTAAGGCPEAVAHEKTGFVVPVGDCEAMAGYVAQLAADPVLYDTLSAAAYGRFKERFTLEHMAAGVRKVLDGIE